MLYDFVIFLPASVCCLHLLLLGFRYKKNLAQNLLLWMMLLTCFYTLGDAIYIMPEEQYTANFALDILTAISTPLIPLLGYILLRTLIGRKTSVPFIASVAVLMVIYTSMLLMSVLLAGPHDIMSLQSVLVSENRTFDFFEGWHGVEALPLGFRTPIFQFYLILTRSVFYVFVLLGVFAVIGYIIKMIIVRRVQPGQFTRFLFKGGSISSFYLMAVTFFLFGMLGYVRIGVGLDAFRSSVLLAVSYSLGQAVVVYTMGYVALLLPAQSFTFKALFQQYSFAERGAADGEEKNTVQKSGPQSESVAVPLPEDADRMLHSLKKLMEEDKLFLNPDLTIEDVASELNTNRVYISRIVNQMMHITFRDYVNQLRIRYSKQYMTKHPEYTQETVAVASGYQDAASFNRKFRQITGVTPREWITRKADDSQQAEESQPAEEHIK